MRTRPLRRPGFIRSAHQATVDPANRIDLCLGHLVTIPRAKNTASFAGVSRSRIPPFGGAMLMLLLLPC